jgi:hypothetical protein
MATSILEIQKTLSAISTQLFSWELDILTDMNELMHRMHQIFQKSQLEEQELSSEYERLLEKLKSIRARERLKRDISKQSAVSHKIHCESKMKLTTQVHCITQTVQKTKQLSEMTSYANGSKQGIFSYTHFDT